MHENQANRELMLWALTCCEDLLEISLDPLRDVDVREVPAVDLDAVEDYLDMSELPKPGVAWVARVGGMLCAVRAHHEAERILDVVVFVQEDRGLGLAARVDPDTMEVWDGPWGFKDNGWGPEGHFVRVWEPPEELGDQPEELLWMACAGTLGAWTEIWRH